MGGVQSQLDSQLPDIQPYLFGLAALESTYEQLPPQPSQLAEDALEEVEALVQGVQQVRRWAGREGPDWSWAGECKRAFF